MRILSISSCVLALLAQAWAQGSAPAEKNPFETPVDLKQGGSLYQTHCSYCHGAFGEGGRGPDLTSGEYIHGGSDSELYVTIRNGAPGSEMPAVKVSDDEVWRMV